MLRLAFPLLFTTTVLLFGQIQGGKRQDVAHGGGINLQQFGGPNVDIIIRGKNMGVVDVSIIDSQLEVVSAEADSDGQSHVVFHPTTFNKSVRLEHGLEVAGTRAEAYLLYETKEGLKVYYFDVIDTKMNECALLVVPPTKPLVQKSAESVEVRLGRVLKLENDGVISHEDVESD